MDCGGRMNDIIRIAIVDDENTVCSQMEEMLMQFLRGINREYEIDVYNSGECIANKLQNNESYHLIFLDIELKQCSGIDVGNFIRYRLMDESTQIVFFSGKDGYDRQLFEFRPLGFIEKPLTLKKVTGIVEKYLRIYGASSELFTYKFNRDVFCVKLCEILYFKSIDKNILIKTINGEEVFPGALKNVKEQLWGKGFFMPNRSYFVNYTFIRSFRPNELVMTNGECISISRSNKDDVSNIRLLLENGGVQ